MAANEFGVYFDFLTPSMVINIVCTELRLPVDQFAVRTRKPVVVDARRIVAWVMSELMHCGPSEISHAINIDRSSVIYHIRKVADLRFSNPFFDKRIKRIVAHIANISHQPPIVTTAMNHVAINPLQVIELIAKNDTSPAQAIHAAIIFCYDHGLIECSLVYRGYTLSVRIDSDLRQKIEQYNYAMSAKTIGNKKFNNKNTSNEQSYHIQSFFP